MDPEKTKEVEVPAPVLVDDPPTKEDQQASYMTELLDDVKAPEPPKAETEGGSEAKGTDEAAGVETPASEVAVEGEVAEATPAVEAVEAPVDVVEPHVAELNRLAELTQRQEAELAALKAPKPAAEVVQVEVPKPEPTLPVGDLSKLNILADESEYSKAFSTVEGANQFARRIIAHALEKIRSEVLPELPKTIAAITQQQTYIETKTRDFFTKNPDLAPYRPYVGYVANQVQAAEPTLDMDKLLEKTAERVRKDVLSKKGETKGTQTVTPPVQKTRPATAGSTGARGGRGVPLDDQQKHMMELLER